MTSLIPLAQKGADGFVRLVIDHSALFDKDILLASESSAEEKPLGYAYFKIDPQGNARLNYICIKSEFRRRGLAKQLILQFIKLYSSKLNSITLEVFDYNEPALKLYESMGFVEKGTNYWYKRNISCNPSIRSMQLQNPEASLISLKSFGFAQFQVLSQGKLSKLGVIGKETIKCSSIETFMDDDLLDQFSVVLPSISQAFFVSKGEISTSSHQIHKVVSSIVLTLNHEAMTLKYLK